MGRLILAALLSSITFSACAITTGNDLYEHGKAYNSIFKLNQEANAISGTEAGMFSGYIMAVNDLAPFCLPEGVKMGQVYDVVFNYLDVHPEARQKPAITLIAKAVHKAWPCK